MKGDLFLLLFSVLAFQKSSFTRVSAEVSDEPIFKLTQTDKRLGDIVRRIDELERQNRTSNRHFPAFGVSSNDRFDYGFDFYSEFSIVDIYESIIIRIERKYEYIEKYEKHRFENVTLINFAEATIRNEISQAPKLHADFLGNKDLLFGGKNLLRFIVDSYKKYPNRTCRSPQSPQQFLYSLYVDIVLTELKFLAMLEWSWLLLGQFGRSGFSEDAVREDFERRINRTRRLMKDQITVADQTVWRCDPKEPKAGVTFDEVTRLLQGYIENEGHLSAEKTCRHDCGHYQSTRSEECHGDEFCSKQPRCGGRLHNCQFVESDLRVCQSEDNSSRRYEFIEGESGRHMGRTEKCSRQMDKAESWLRWLVKCDYCFCLCDEEGPQSDRYFNLRPVTADIGKNRVVTGLRFVKHNRIFHLQIQEGEVLAQGAIKGTTLQWKPLDSYSISDEDVKKDVDFHVLSYENRSIDLVEVRERSNFVVTGLRFRVVGGHLSLEAQFSGFDFESGQLSEPTYWLSAGSKKARIIVIENSKVSSESSASSESYLSDNDQFVEFTASGLEEDAAQTTVPLIDIQKVVSEPPVPLSGIGVYFRGSKGHGGYVAPKLITYDYSQNAELTTK